eukprot:862089-Amphidinium_carterae.1
MAHTPAGTRAVDAAFACSTGGAWSPGKAGGLGFGAELFEVVPEEAEAAGPVPPGRAAPPEAGGGPAALSSSLKSGGALYLCTLVGGPCACVSPPEEALALVHGR